MDKTFMSQKWCRNQKEEGLYWYYIMTKANIERTWKIALLQLVIYRFSFFTSVSVTTTFVFCTVILEEPLLQGFLFWLSIVKHKERDSWKRKGARKEGYYPRVCFCVSGAS